MYSGYRAVQIYPDAVHQIGTADIEADSKRRRNGSRWSHFVIAGIKIDGGTIGVPKRGALAGCRRAASDD